MAGVARLEGRFRRLLGGPQNADYLLDPPLLAAELAMLGLAVTCAHSVRQRATTSDGEDVDVVNAVIHAVKPALGSNPHQGGGAG